jgi:hypothetical protein
MAMPTELLANGQIGLFCRLANVRGETFAENFVWDKESHVLAELGATDAYGTCADGSDWIISADQNWIRANMDPKKWSGGANVVINRVTMGISITPVPVNGNDLSFLNRTGTWVITAPVTDSAQLRKCHTPSGAPKF